MNSDIMPSIVQMEKRALMNLVKEVKETIATDIIIPEVKPERSSFTAADMWNIRRKMKTAYSYWNK